MPEPRDSQPHAAPILPMAVVDVSAFSPRRCQQPCPPWAEQGARGTTLLGQGPDAPAPAPREHAAIAPTRPTWLGTGGEPRDHSSAAESSATRDTVPESIWARHNRGAAVSADARVRLEPDFLESVPSALRHTGSIPPPALSRLRSQHIELIVAAALVAAAIAMLLLF